MSKPIEKSKRYFVALLELKTKDFINKLEQFANKNEILFKVFDKKDEVVKYLNSEVLKSDNSQLVFYTDAGNLDWVINQKLTEKLYLHLILESEKDFVPQNHQLDKIQSVLTIPKKATESIDLSEIYGNFSYDPTMGIEYYIGKPDKECSRLIYNKDQKKQVIQELNDFVLELATEKTHRVFQDHATITTDMLDELLLNAVFNANPRFKDADRKIDFSLQEDEAIKVAWGISGENFAISVTDPFGSLGKEDTLVHALNSLNKELDQKTSGGRGLRVVYERSNSLIVNLLPGKRTEIICVLKLSNRIKRYKLRFKSIQFQSVG